MLSESKSRKINLQTRLPNECPKTRHGKRICKNKWTRSECVDLTGGRAVVQTHHPQLAEQRRCFEGSWTNISDRSDMHSGCYVLSVVRVVQVSQGPVGGGLINPSSQILQEHVPSLDGSNGRCEALPVTYTPLAKIHVMPSCNTYPWCRHDGCQEEHHICSRQSGRSCSASGRQTEEPDPGSAGRRRRGCTKDLQVMSDLFSFSADIVGHLP